MITTYDNFFKFFISIIGEEHKIPLELQNRLREATFFMFMGFDLTKWYIPLLMHKLSSFKDSADDSPTLVNNDNIRNGLNMSHLPLELLILDHDTVPILNTLATYFSSEEVIDNFGLSNAEREQIIFELKELEEEVIEDVDSAYLDMLKKLEIYFEKVELENSFIKTIRGRYNRYRIKKLKRTISNDDAETESLLILEAILDLINEVRNQLTPTVA